MADGLISFIALHVVSDLLALFKEEVCRDEGVVYSPDLGYTP
jgi:hypothetical protein